MGTIGAEGQKNQVHHPAYQDVKASHRFLWEGNNKLYRKFIITHLVCSWFCTTKFLSLKFLQGNIVTRKKKGNIVGTRVNEMSIQHPSCESSERNQEQSVVTASCPVLSLIAVALHVPSPKLH
jgi:hypothetical protein